MFKRYGMLLKWDRFEFYWRHYSYVKTFPWAYGVKRERALNAVTDKFNIGIDISNNYYQKSLHWFIAKEPDKDFMLHNYRIIRTIYTLGGRKHPFWNKITFGLFTKTTYTAHISFGNYVGYNNPPGNLGTKKEEFVLCDILGLHDVDVRLHLMADHGLKPIYKDPFSKCYLLEKDSDKAKAILVANLLPEDTVVNTGDY